MIGTDSDAIVWRKSRASGSGGACVEVALTGRSTLVRDSKDPSGPILSFSPLTWTCFVADVRRSSAA